MKCTILFFIIILAIGYDTANAQVQQKKGSGQTAVGYSINFAERAKAEDKSYLKRGQFPPNEKFEAENEEEKIQFKNQVISASQVNKVQQSLPPSNAIARGPSDILSAPCLDFQGVITNTSAPPDPNGSAGFETLMGTTNFTIRTQNKTGGLINELQFTTFFAGVGGHGFIFDPRIHYDQYAQRWVFVCGGSGNSANSAILVAISQSSDPNGGWWIYNIDADGSDVNWMDYPVIGINKNWITISGNMFKRGAAGAFYSRVWALNKSQAYVGASVGFFFWDFSNLFTIAPASNYDPLEDRMWLVTNWNSNSGGSGFVRILNMTGTAASPALALGNIINVGTAWTSGGVGASQTGTALQINAGDDRVQNTVYRNGVIWFAQSYSQPAAAPTYTGVQMIALNPFTGTHIETIRVVDVGGSILCAFPSVTANKDNDVCMAYNTFYTTGYASAAVSLRRGGGSLESYVTKGGEDWYYLDVNGSNRFGDYSSAMVDPEDDKTMWVFGEYARSNGGAAGTNAWGTWWAKVCPNFCVNDQAVTGAVGAGYARKFEANNTITATVQILNGATMKLDAGTRVTLSPGFRANDGSKVQVYIEGCGGVR
jgi:hypothetical protein